MESSAAYDFFLVCFSGLHVNSLMFCAASIPIQREDFVTGMRWYHFNDNAAQRKKSRPRRCHTRYSPSIGKNFVPHDATLNALNPIGLYDLAAFSMHIGSVSHGEILRYDGVLYGQSDESIFNLG